MILRARHFQFSFPRPSMIMGVVNVTPDSFSDGGQFLDPARALDHARQLIEEGADIIDIGGESTRPGALPVGEEEELRRVIPVIEQLALESAVPISVDTMKPAVARAALAAGAAIVNDVAANRADPEMWRMVAETGAAYVVMHMQGTPSTMQDRPAYADVTGVVGEFFDDRLQRLADCGVTAEQVILDPGLGFGKTAEHNLQLLAGLGSFTKWNRPLLLGVSRKSFIARVAAATETASRLPGSLACVCWGIQSGGNIFRTHDVAETKQAVRMTEAILARKKE